MDPRQDRRRAPRPIGLTRRVLPAVALALLLVASASAAWIALPEQARGTLAKTVAKQLGEGGRVVAGIADTIAAWWGGDDAELAAASVIELRISETARVDGFLRGDELAPGDEVEGVIHLATANGDPAGHRLGIAARVRSGDGAALALSSLRWGGEEWAPRLAERDANADGVVSMDELSDAWLGLPAPPEEGAPMHVTVRFAPPADRDPNAYQGARIVVAFEFTLVALGGSS